MIRKTLFVLVAALFLGSCSSSKTIPYFQDLQAGRTENVVVPKEIKVRPGDEIYIMVNSMDSKLTELFNLIPPQSTSGNGRIGYTVDANGEIDFPVLGTIHVAGKTRQEVASFIKSELKGQNLVQDPVVVVDFENLCVSVIGEVANPGQFSIEKDRVTILDAISKAGDLTIYGNREKVVVLREEDGKQVAYTVNLCSAEQMYASPVYYLQQNDVVYVEPNDVRARQSTVNGNAMRTPAFWISLVSFLTTIIVLIAK